MLTRRRQTSNWRSAIASLATEGPVVASTRGWRTITNFRSQPEATSIVTKVRGGSIKFRSRGSLHHGHGAAQIGFRGFLLLIGHRGPNRFPHTAFTRPANPLCLDRPIPSSLTGPKVFGITTTGSVAGISTKGSPPPPKANPPRAIGSSHRSTQSSWRWASSLMTLRSRGVHRYPPRCRLGHEFARRDHGGALVGLDHLQATDMVVGEFGELKPTTSQSPTDLMLVNKRHAAGGRSRRASSRRKSSCRPRPILRSPKPTPRPANFNRGNSMALRSGSRWAEAAGPSCGSHPKVEENRLAAPSTCGNLQSDVRSLHSA